ncbi:hypothetical protein OV450_0244 [Actinobacteria bacterium OV450]|nr:hypothetical protein OV450_0244 [Actinobacteria bacterium OV450]
MNDPTTPAATQDDGPRGLPGTTDAPTPTSTEPIRTLLETAGACPPVEEVAAPVNLLEDEGQGPDRRHRALRAAVVGRPVRDVALPAGIFGTEEDGGPAAPGRTAPPVAPAHTAPPAGTARSAGPTGSSRPNRPHPPGPRAGSRPTTSRTTSRTGPRTGAAAP